MKSAVRLVRASLVTRAVLIVSIVGLCARGGQSATLQAILKDQDAGNAAPGSTHRIQLWVKTNYDGTKNLGIASAEFEILSSGTGRAQYTGTTSFNTVGVSNPVVGLGYSKINAVKLDGSEAPGTWVPQPVVGAAADGDSDAISLYFYAAPGNVVIKPSSSTFVGTVGSPGGPGGNGMNNDANGFEELAVENWTFQSSDTLNLYIDASPTSAMFFGPNFDSSGANTTKSYSAFGAQNISASGISVGISTVVPEPASLVLMTLGGLALLTLAARRKRGWDPPSDRHHLIWPAASEADLPANNSSASRRKRSSSSLCGACCSIH